MDLDESPAKIRHMHDQEAKECLGNGWISVKEKLPLKHTGVVVLFKYKKGFPTHGYGINTIDNDEWVNQPEETEITHWMPLPKPPSFTQGSE